MTITIIEPQHRDPVATHFVQLLVDYLSGRRDFTILRAFCDERLAGQLETWRRVQPRGNARVTGVRGARVSPRVLEASFSLAWPEREETFTLRLEQRGPRWHCVHLGPLRPLAARVSPRRGPQPAA